MTPAELAVANALAAARSADPSKAGGTRDPFFPPGSHQSILAEISPDFEPDERGRPQAKIWVRFLVEESTQPQLETPIICAKMYDLQRRPQYESQSSDADEFMLLLMQASGLPNDTTLGTKSRLLGLFEDVIHRRAGDQLLRGRALRVDGSFGKPVKGVEYRQGLHGHQLYEDRGKEKNRWVNTNYAAIAQTAEETAALRAFLDESYPIRERKREVTPRDDRAERTGGYRDGYDERDARAERPTAPAPRAGGALARMRQAKAGGAAGDGGDDIPF